eukprot:RCo051424
MESFMLRRLVLWQPRVVVRIFTSGEGETSSEQYPFSERHYGGVFLFFSLFTSVVPLRATILGVEFWRAVNGPLPVRVSSLTGNACNAPRGRGAFSVFLCGMPGFQNQML